MAVQFDYAKLLGRIREFGFTQRDIASKIGISHSTFNAKVNNNYAFTSSEIRNLCKVLSIKSDEIGSYFFTPKVQKI